MGRKGGGQWQQRKAAGAQQQHNRPAGTGEVGQGGTSSRRAGQPAHPLEAIVRDCIQKLGQAAQAAAGWVRMVCIQSGIKQKIGELGGNE